MKNTNVPIRLIDLSYGVQKFSIKQSQCLDSERDMILSSSLLNFLIPAGWLEWDSPKTPKSWWVSIISINLFAHLDLRENYLFNLHDGLMTTSGNHIQVRWTVALQK